MKGTPTSLRHFPEVGDDVVDIAAVTWFSRPEGDSAALPAEEPSATVTAAACPSLLVSVADPRHRYGRIGATPMGDAFKVVSLSRELVLPLVVSK
jgi:hypothetical protein